MVYVRKRTSKTADSDAKSEGEDNEQSSSKRSRRSVNDGASAKVQTPVSPTKKQSKTSLVHNDTPITQPQTPTRRVLRRSTHLLVSPVPQAHSPSQSKRLSKKLSENPPQALTPTRLTRSRRLSADHSDVPSEVQTCETPTKKSRQLMSDLSGNNVSSPRVQTPVRRSRRLSTDLSNAPTEEVQTSTRRSSRRNSVEPDDTHKSLPQTLMPVRRSRRLSTDSDDVPALQVQTPTRRSRRLSADLSEAPPEVGTPTRHSRRLSMDEPDVVVDDSDKLQAKPIKVTTAADAPSRRSRRMSGANSVSDKPMCVLLEEEEEDEGIEGACESKPDTLETIIEDEKETEPDSNITAATTKVDVVTIEEIDSDDDLQIVEVKGPSSEKKKDMHTEKVATHTENKNLNNTHTLEEENLNTEVQEDSVENENLNNAHTLEEEKLNTEVQEDSVVDEKENEPNSSGLGTDRLRLTSDEENSEEDLRIVEGEKQPATEMAKERESTAVLEDRENNVVSSTTKAKSEMEKGVSQPNSEIKSIKVINGSHQKLNNNNEENKKISGVRGMPVSGRWWKEEKKRFKSINKDQGPKSSWAGKMKRKQDMKDMLALKNAIAEEKKRKKADLRERQRLNTVRKEENARKSEIVQVIKDSRKIKKMKRKQLRYIETRDTSLIKKS